MFTVGVRGMVLFALPSLLTITMTIEWFACLNDTDGFLLAAPATETWAGTVDERWNASQYNGGIRAVAPAGAGKEGASILRRFRIAHCVPLYPPLNCC